MSASSPPWCRHIPPTSWTVCAHTVPPPRRPLAKLHPQNPRSGQIAVSVPRACRRPRFPGVCAPALPAREGPGLPPGPWTPRQTPCRLVAEALGAQRTAVSGLGFGNVDRPRSEKGAQEEPAAAVLELVLGN